MNVKELKKALKAMNVEFPSKAKKAELEALLESAQAEQAEESLTAEERKQRGFARQAVSQKETLNISDRRIMCLSGDENLEYKNCCQAWKADEFSSSQCDTLSGKLFGPAKKEGKFDTQVEIAGRVWVLAQAYEAGLFA